MQLAADSKPNAQGVSGRSREWQTGIPNLVRATKTDNFQMCAILLAFIELDCHSREC